MRKCRVYVHGVYAGELTEIRNPREYIFEYEKEYVKLQLEPVSLTMPVRMEPYRSSVLFPYFFNMLSEGENRDIQSSLLKIDRDDDFGILLATALVDTPGAVTVQPITIA